MVSSFTTFYFIETLTFPFRSLQGHRAHQLHMPANHRPETLRLETRWGRCWADHPWAGSGRKLTQGNSVQNLLPWRQAGTPVGVSLRNPSECQVVAVPASQVVHGRPVSRETHRLWL